MADEGFDALSAPHTSNPDSGVDEITAKLVTALEETPRDDTGKFVARAEESELAETTPEKGEVDESEDAAPEEVSGEDDGTDAVEEEAEDDEPEEAIDAPASWTDEEKTAFAELPPETQITIAGRESEREKHINARLAETAADRKATQAEQTAAQTERQNLANTLAQVSAYARTMDPVISRGLNTDWAALSREEGADEAMAQKAEFDSRVQYLQAVEGETARLQQASHAQHKQAETAKLHDAMPDFKDALKAQSIKDSVLSTALDAGYTTQEVDMLWDFVPGTDHRQVKVLEKAAKYDKLMKERETIVSKKAAKTAPRVQKPKAQQEAGTQKNGRITALRKQVRQDPGNIDKLTELAQQTIGANR